MLRLRCCNAKGYLYAYIAFLEDPPEPTTDGRSLYPQGVVEESGTGSAGGGIGVNDGNGEGSQVGGGSCIILVSVEASSEQFQAFRRARTALESRFRSALGAHWDRYLGEGAGIEREGILTKFCTQMQALHFYYCLRGRHGGTPCVTQCLSPPFVDRVADDLTAQRRIWGHYTRAALRLRRGSCQEGRVVCRAEKNGGLHNGAGGGGGAPDEHRSPDPRVGDEAWHDQASALFESDPVHSLVYEVGAKETVVSLFGHRENGSGGVRWPSPSTAGESWGDRDELHACFPSSVPPEVAYTAAIRLVAIIRRDREWLFLTGSGASK